MWYPFNMEVKIMNDEPLVRIGGSQSDWKKWLTKSKGFYLQGFTTKINQATDLDVKQSPLYLTQLISRYHSLDQRLIGLYRSGVDSSVTSVTYNYWVGMGKIVIGKATVLIQSLNNVNTISFTYQYRVTASEYRAKNTNIKSRHAGGNSLNGQRKTIARWRDYDKERHD